MAEHPAWDYWMYDDLGNDRIISIHEGRSLSEADIRNEEYDLDVEKWCRKWYWEADEAATISFGRDPDKVKNEAEYPLPIAEAGDRAKHNELIGHIDTLEGLIIEAQERKLLPSPFFPPAMYVEWSRRVGVSVPEAIWRELEKVERERVPKAGFAERSDDVESDSNDVESDPDDEWEKKGGGQKENYKSSVKRLILALLIESGRIRKDRGVLSQTLASVLETKADDQGDKKLVLGAQTIKNRLDEAHGLLK